MLTDISAMLESVTEAAINHAGSKQQPLDEARDKPVGTIHSEICKRLCIASQKFGSLSKEYEAKAEASENEVEELELSLRSSRYSTLGRLCDALFITQVREDLNFHNGRVGIRSGWMAVEHVGEDDGPAAILGGLLRLGPR